MDLHSIPRSTLTILFVSIVLSTFYARYSGRDLRMKYAMFTVKEKMAEMKKYQRKFKETQDERYLRKALRVQKEIMEIQKRLFKYQLKRMAVSMILFFSLYYALAYYFGYKPVAYAPFRIPHDIRSVPTEYAGRIISGLTFIGRYFLSSITLALTLQFIMDKVNRSNLIRGLKRLFSRVFTSRRRFEKTP